MEFLPVGEMREREAEVRGALRTFLASRAAVTRPGARQWQFFRAGVERALGAPRSPFDALTAVEAAQLKFMVQSKLRSWYVRKAGAHRLEFLLVHQNQLGRYRLSAPDRYPRLAGYCFLVRDVQRDPTLPTEGADTLRDYLERVVTDAARSELTAYRALPDLRLAPLQRWFLREGEAYEEILDRLQRRRRDGWVLSNPSNPSNQRTLKVRIEELTGDHARVVTSEHWYLRWWSPSAEAYIYAFREQLHLTYVLERQRQDWRVRRRTASRGEARSGRATPGARLRSGAERAQEACG